MSGLRVLFVVVATIVFLLLAAQAVQAADVVFEPGTTRAIRIDNLEVGGTMYTVTFEVQATAHSVYGPFTGNYTFTDETAAAEARDAIIAALNTAGALSIGESGNAFDGQSFNVGYEGIEVLEVQSVNTARSVIDGSDWISLGINTWTYNLDEKDYAVFSGGGGECTYSITPTTRSYPSTGSEGQITVDTQEGCDWTASSNAGWTTIASGNAGTGPGTVRYGVDPNTGADRTATILAAGRNHTVHQSGCTYSITPGMRSFPSEGGTGTITVDTQEGCDWTASSNAGWAAITSGEAGTGPGSVSYSVDPNIGAERTANIRAAGEDHGVDQAAVEDVGGGGDLDNGTFIAAASFAAGAEGSFFQTDVDVNNTDDDTVTYRFVWLPRGADNSSPLISQEFTLEAGESTRFENLLAGVFGLSEGVNGAVAVAADSAGLIVNSRTYNLPTVKVSGTFGQAIAGVPEEDLIEANDIWRITFMSENADFRANLGCVNGRDENLRIFIDLYGDSGELLETTTLDLAPLSNNQLNKVFRDYAPINGYADVRATQAGAAFWCYGSVLDNGSSDPTTVVPVKHDQEGSAPNVVQVFMTNLTYRGNLGGLAGADAKCQDNAADAGLIGSWTAWLSDGTGDAIDRIPDGEYQLVDGTVIADDKADLTDGFLKAPIDLNQFGSPEPGNVWTGTQPDGTDAGTNCSNWTVNDGGPPGCLAGDSGCGIFGTNTATIRDWTQTSDNGGDCSNLFNLYCFGGGQ